MKKPQLGLTSGSLAVLGPGGILDIAREASLLGYSSIWTVEAAGTDAFSLLGALAAAAPGLGLAAGVVPVQLRTPTLVAMTAGTLQALAPDRDLLLGLGVSAPGILRRHGLPAPSRPIAMMREYVALLRECLGGEPVNFAGDFWQVKNFRLSVRLGERRPKLIMAALNPQMLRLAGEIADGVLLNYMPASHVPAAVRQVRKGGNATIYAYVHASVTDFAEGAASARRDLFGYAMADGYARMLRAASFAEEVDRLREKYAQKDREGALAAISERMIQSINFMGTREEVRAFVQSYMDAGVEYPVLMPLPFGDDRKKVVLRTMQAAAEVLS